MTRSLLTRSIARVLALVLLAAACDAEAKATDAASTASVESTDVAPVDFTAADLDGYVRGLEKEAALVQEARARGRAARTPAERAAAAQGEWEHATIAGGAQAAGMPIARYRDVRATVNRVLQTLDFQGKIDGPQEIDASAASPELARRLASDAFAELAPASAAALRARLDAVVRAYVAYMTLVAVNG